MCIIFFIALARKSAVETLPARLPFVNKGERVVRNRAQLKKLETKIYESYGDDEWCRRLLILPSSTRYQFLSLV